MFFTFFVYALLSEAIDVFAKRKIYRSYTAKKQKDNLLKIDYPFVFLL